MPIMSELPSGTVNSNTVLAGTENINGSKKSANFSISSILNYISTYFQAKPVVLTSTLVAGYTELEFNDAAIDSTKTIGVCTDVFGVNPTNMSVSGHVLTITFDEWDSDIGVKVEVTS